MLVDDAKICFVNRGGSPRIVEMSREHTGSAQLLRISSRFHNCRTGTR